MHFAITDPNPDFSRENGLNELEAAGIQIVEEGSDGAEELYEAFAKHITTGTPFVPTKYAMTLDGKIATHTGDSKWVKGHEARRYVQGKAPSLRCHFSWRQHKLSDDPYLTARDDDGSPLERQPLRVVLDSVCSTPLNSAMLGQPGSTLIATTEAGPDARILALEQTGAELVVLPAGEDQE
ncbi:MAG: hypothetical protein Ct9H300mP11_32680 [Chloroflexota bacterium]|nr:MAG: hypothetical protein Ct9H300mP11_32680 [Chloroflexota bacterium]